MTYDEALTALNNAGFVCNHSRGNILARWRGKGPLLAFAPDRNGNFDREEIDYATNRRAP